MISLCLYGLEKAFQLKSLILNDTLQAPKTNESVDRNSLIAEMYRLASSRDWSSLSERLSSIEGDVVFRDVFVYFKGYLYSNGQPAPDPERYLALVPPESSLYLDAQRLRLRNWASAKKFDEELAARIATSMEEANGQNTIYFRLKLARSNMTYEDVADLYSDFTRRFVNMFDFAGMRHEVKSKVSGYVEVHVTEILSVPGCVFLFLVRLIETSHNECLSDFKRNAVRLYEQFITHNPDLNGALGLLYINPNIKQYVDELRVHDVPRECDAKTSGGT